MCSVPIQSLGFRVLMHGLGCRVPMGGRQITMYVKYDRSAM